MAPNSLPQANYFRLVPPTPSQATQPITVMRHTSTYQPLPPAQSQITVNPKILPGPRPISAPHLHPAPILPSWRSQRSASISSTASGHSAVGGSWSSASGSAHGENDADPSDPEGMGATMGQMIFGTGQAPRVGARRALGRAATLSIDPNLVRPRPGMLGGGGGGSSTAKPKSAQADEEMPTAKPKKRGGDKVKASPKAKKVSHARKLNADHIPRPRNAFILFRKHVVDAKLIPASVEIRHQNVSVIVAKMWADAPVEQKERFAEFAKVEKEDHLKKYPGYRYQPVYRRTNVIRRRVRKDEADEEKCNNVAALLLKGTSGVELEEEIKDMQQPPTTKGAKSRKTSAANELSKGALRALRAQARQQSLSDQSDTHSQSVDSCGGSPDSDLNVNGASHDFHSRRSSIASDLEFGLGLDGKYDLGLAPSGFHPGQLAQDGYTFGMAPQGQGLLAGGMLPQYTVNAGWAPGLQQQTWAYPDQNQGGLMPINDFTYQQPTHMDPFFNYDQALPFSPTAHQFEQPFAYPNTSSVQTHSYTNPTLDPSTMYGADRPVYAEPYQQQQQPGGMTLAPYAPQSAKWDAGFHPGAEGLPFDEALLGDFGAALMQAEEAGVW